MPKAKKQKEKKRKPKLVKAKRAAKRPAKRPAKPAAKPVAKPAAKRRTQERKKKRAKVIAKLMAMRKKKTTAKKPRKIKAPKPKAIRQRAPKPRKARAAVRPAVPPAPPKPPPRPKRRKPPYSKEQIETLRKELLEERARLVEELGELDEIAQNSRGEGRSEAPGYSIHPAEYATDTQTIDTALGLRSLAQRHLDEVEIALEQLKSGEYGYCEGCDKPIEFERLLAKPSARFCINCRKSFEAGTLGS